MDERLRAVVAIPVRDEAERIETCLLALAAQRDARGLPLPQDACGIVLLLNNCTDGTAAVVRRLQEHLPYRLWTLERRLADGMAHAGWARKLAMDAAADLLADRGVGRSGVILTTDADGRVGGRWLAANLGAIVAGADLVAGLVRAERAEHARLPDAVIRRGRMESRYEWLLAELQARLDPQPHDPWPCHRIASGASLAVTLATYRDVGGLPPDPVGEDRAFAARIARRDGRVRHSLAAQVAVSCRLDGRAVGGMAATIRERALRPEIACDPALEPVANLIRRARWRVLLRRWHRQRPRTLALGRVAELALSRSALAAALAHEHFGEAWAAIERASPALAFHPLRPRELPDQIELAEGLLAGLRGQPRRAAPPALGGMVRPADRAIAPADREQREPLAETV